MVFVLSWLITIISLMFITLLALGNKRCLKLYKETDIESKGALLGAMVLPVFNVIVVAVGIFLSLTIFVIHKIEKELNE